jgi:hypothetical protein
MLFIFHSYHSFIHVHVVIQKEMIIIIIIISHLGNNFGAKLYCSGVKTHFVFDLQTIIMKISYLYQYHAF